MQHGRAPSHVLATLQDAPGPAGAGLAAEVERLRTLLERQPACLMRVGIDGTLLAVSDAAICLLGAQALVQVLGTSLIERLHGEADDIWSDFVRRVLQAGSASLECEMSDLADVHRAVIVQGVSLPAHPDGGESLLITCRDVSTARRLQASLEEVTAERRQLRAALDAALAEREELAAAINQLKIALGTAVDSTLLAQQVIEKGAHK